MRILRFLLISILLSLPLPALAYDVLVLQSLREKGYDEAVSGVRRQCQASLRTVVLSDYAEADLTRILREEHPRLIIAVGDRALTLAEKQHNTIPVLYMMALNPKPRQKVSGVGMLLEPARYLSVFDSLNARRVGVVYSPRSAPYLRKAQSVAKRYGIELVTREVHNAKETPAMLESLHGKVDAIWMLPDPTAVSPASTEAYFLFSQAERVPVVTFAEVYLSMGGAVALAIDRFDIGKQLGEMAQSLLDGTPIESLPPQSPRRAVTKSNDGVLRRLKTVVGMGDW